MNNLDTDKESGNPSKENIKQQKILRPLPIIRALFLALILKNPQITGYKILQIVPEVINTSLKLKTGTVYTELRKLEKAGLVQSTQVSEGRKRRHYIITSSGLKELKDLNKQINSRIHTLLEPLLEFIGSTLIDV